MNIETVLICVDPPIPNTFLNNLAGWLLGAMLDSEQTTENNVPCTRFISRELKDFPEVDERFITLFEATCENDVLKRALVYGNADLSGRNYYSVGEWIFVTRYIDLEAVVQRVIVESNGEFASACISFIQVDRETQPLQIDMACLSVTADKVILLEQSDAIAAHAITTALRPTTDTDS